jgi:hypothetical protein
MAGDHIGTLTRYVRSTDDKVDSVSRAVGTNTLGTNTVLGLLHAICGNTNTASPSGACY